APPAVRHGRSAVVGDGRERPTARSRVAEQLGHEGPPASRGRRLHRWRADDAAIRESAPPLKPKVHELESAATHAALPCARGRTRVRAMTSRPGLFLLGGALVALGACERGGAAGGRSAAGGAGAGGAMSSGAAGADGASDAAQVAEDAKAALD